MRRYGAPRLLRVVGNKPHATDEDHEQTDVARKVGLVGQPRVASVKSGNGSQSLASATKAIAIESDEDYNRDPESSDAENTPPIKTNALDRPASSSRVSTNDKSKAKSAKSNASNPTTFTPGTILERPSTSSVPDQDESDDGDNEIFSGQSGSRKRQRKGSRFLNIHAPGRDKIAHRPRKTIKYSSQEKTSAQSAPQKQPAISGPKQGAGPKFRIPPGSTNATVAGDKPPPKRFKKPEAYVPMSSFSTESQHSTPDANALSINDNDFLDDDLSSALSSHSESEIEQLRASSSYATSVPNSSALTHSAPLTPRIKCSICGTRLSRSVREDFEDEFLQGAKLATFKWQRRFCQYHRRQTAHDTWQARGYPQIDWSGLRERLQRHEAYLTRVLQDEVPSHHRMQLKKKSEGGKKGIQQMFQNAVPGSSVGYYGPRGEKIMTLHITTTLATHLRHRALNDRLVAVAGVQGGVAGFVQAVLVPHLAELLVIEDLFPPGSEHAHNDDTGPDDSDAAAAVAVVVEDGEPPHTRCARRVIAQSAELGELLHPETEDVVRDGEEDEDDDDDGEEKEG